MKALSRIVLSVLLFTFSLFVVHDYLIEKVDADTQYELCCIQMDIASLDLPSQIHSHIHLVLDVPLAQTGVLPLRLTDNTPESPLFTPYWHTDPVRLRPPLS